MKYNIYLDVGDRSFNLLNISQYHVGKVANSYKQGLSSFTINNKTYSFKAIDHISICEDDKNPIELEVYAMMNKLSSIEGEILESFGKNVTAFFLENKPFGYEKEIKLVDSRYDEYINTTRIEELKKINNIDFDLSKLIRVCEELNTNWRNNNYYTIGLLLRTIINHVPPIFGAYNTFDTVVANYSGGVSFKKNMEFLNNALRSTADGYNHQTIRKKELLPNEQQVDYRGNIDILLCEILRII